MGTPALEISGLTKVYASGFKALNGIDLSVEQGDFFALLGPNGAGKSTTIGIVASLIRKTAGQVKIFGYDVDTDISKAKRHLGLVPQEFNFNVFEPIREVVANQAGYFGIDKATALQRTEFYLKKLELWDKRNEAARLLSGGMKRRLMIARALVNNPKLLILDEPTAGVDIEIRHSMWNFLRQINAEGTTIILTTHYLEEAENLCRNIAIIDDGEIVVDTAMQDLLSQLHMESFIVGVKPFSCDMPAQQGFNFKRIDANTLEVEVFDGGSLNNLFAVFSRCGIEVTSFRNKSNRLEQLFMHLVADDVVDES